jgi:hypothetical protein
MLATSLVLCTSIINLVANAATFILSFPLSLFSLHVASHPRPLDIYTSLTVRKRETSSRLNTSESSRFRCLG